MRLSVFLFHLCLYVGWLVGWSLASLFSTNMPVCRTVGNMKFGEGIGLGIGHTD